MTRGTKGIDESYNQRAKVMRFKVQGTGTAAILQGAGLGTLVDNGTGDWTITYTNPGSRLLSVLIQPITSAMRLALHSDTSATKVRVLGFGYNNATASDVDFWLTVVVSTSSYGE